ncbi:MAG TPA: hypothetical protein VJ998_05000 [Pseudomonadales bacterium]|nr:hypothetical protein [Pseudomonadales bacterium]
MSTDTKTRARESANNNPSRNPLFDQLPDQYYGYALQWCAYPRWTIEETANLLTGCVPHREMFLKGEQHRRLDEEVLANENRIRAALGKQLKIVESKKYFAKTYIDASNIIEWARSEAITIPNELMRAHRETHQHWEMHGYRTPCMEAIDWAVKTFWENADLRDPPNPGEIVHALLQTFPELSPEECELVERVTRHPAARDPVN